MKIADTPSVVSDIWPLPWWGGLMPAKDRECSILVKMSRENRDRLVQEAAQLGITRQALAERRLLGITVEAIPPGRAPRAQTEELPLTG